VRIKQPKYQITDTLITFTLMPTPFKALSGPKMEKERDADVKRETQETNEGLLARFTL
jgi:hypothetical protein